MRAFIDGLSLVRIESQSPVSDVRIREMTLKRSHADGNGVFFTSPEPLRLHEDDTVIVDGEHVVLEIGMVTLTDAFDEAFRFDGPLGYVYSPQKTCFALFTPVAKDVILVLDGQDYPMTYDMPVWRAEIKGDVEGRPYHYRVRLYDVYHDVQDPYADAIGFRDQPYVIDWSKTTPVVNHPGKVRKMTDVVLYEGHVRDLTTGLDVPSKGLYEGLTETSTLLGTSVLGYIRNLGVTHLQLLPVFDFDGVDDHDKPKLYNWGYNPARYFALEGWYARDPDDPYGRINAFKHVINSAHEIGLGITMDVVYNHVFKRDTFPYDYLVPGYFFRHDVSGAPSDASFCGNDVETRRYMVRRLIVDSLVRFVTRYGVDGFRFDLMGLLDVKTMLLAEKTLKAIKPDILLYGEGWNMPNAVPAKDRSNMANQARFPGYAHFNDTFRNTVKGDLHGPAPGYAMGSRALCQKMPSCLLGSPDLFESPAQSINYVECHDNMTFYDKMLLSAGFEKEAFKEMADLAMHLVVISQGIPFIHAGQEFFRTKKGVENSYNSPDEINMIHWKPNSPSVRLLKKLLRIRRSYRLYRSPSYGDHASVSKEGDRLVYRLEDNKVVLVHHIKNRKGLERIETHGGTLIFRSRNVLVEDDAVIVDEPGVYILKLSKS